MGERIVALKINISFKLEEQEMYNFLKSHLSPSIYMKELIQREMESKSIKPNPNKKKGGYEMNF